MTRLRDDGWLWPAGIVLAAALVLVRVTGVMHSDFRLEAWAAYVPLMHGDLSGAWQHAPGYVGFAALVGAPLAALGDLLGLGASGVFRLTALPGAAALVALAVVLARRARDTGMHARPLIVLLVCASPLAWYALHYGHPEDLLAAAAVVLGVWWAADGRFGLATAGLAVAVLAKQWAIIGLLPAMAVAPRREALRLLVVVGGALGVTVLAQALGHPAGTAQIATTGQKFHTRQLWFPLGLETMQHIPGVRPGERIAPAWLVPISHPLVVALAIPVTAAWRWRGGREHDGAEVFLLLALLFLLRCLLDPWNMSYYHLPLMLSLLAWEVRRGRRWPIASCLVTGAVVLSFFGWETSQGYGAWLSYVGWSAPLVAVIAVRLWRGTASPDLRMPAGWATPSAPAQVRARA